MKKNPINKVDIRHLKCKHCKNETFTRTTTTTNKTWFIKDPHNEDEELIFSHTVNVKTIVRCGKCGKKIKQEYK